MKQFIVAVVLLFTVWNGEALGSAIRNKRDLGCPPPGFGICVERCSSDGGCRDGEICCFNGCGHTCTKPVRCPSVKPGTHGICVEECSGDSTCPAGKACCFNGCGHVCL